MEINFWVLLPEILLSLVGIGIMLAAPFLDRSRQSRLGYVALLGIAAAFVPILFQWGLRETGYFDMVFLDPFGLVCKLLFLFAGAGVVLTSIDYLERENILRGEYFAMILFATVGMSLMATSADLIMTFLGLEILSISTYVLAGLRWDDFRSTEAAWKYFILGAFSTAFMLYGIAFIYGATGSTKYLEVAASIAASPELYPLLAGLGLIIVGFGFKAALAPFQVWTPDVYQGAPIPITAHLAVASKTAAIVAFVRVLYQMLPELSDQWQVILWASAILTLGVGNIAALVQTNIKRLLAYSSIAHAGYLLIGVVAHSEFATQSVLYYLGAYALMSLGAFAVVQILSRRGEEKVEIDDYTGIGFRHPFLSVSLSVFLISLAGIPSTAGFMGKLFLFSAAIESQFYWLVILGVIASAIGLYYYLRIIVLMFMHESEGDDQDLLLPVPGTARVAIVIMVAGTFLLGLYPTPFLNLLSEAAGF